MIEINKLFNNDEACVEYLANTLDRQKCVIAHIAKAKISADTKKKMVTCPLKYKEKNDNMSPEIEFKPEYAGKMAFYLAQVDKKLKKSTDNYSVGIILCQKSNLEIQEDTINYITKPMGVSGYQLAENKTYLPKELEALEELKNLI